MVTHHSAFLKNLLQVLLKTRAFGEEAAGQQCLKDRKRSGKKDEFFLKCSISLTRAITSSCDLALRLSLTHLP